MFAAELTEELEDSEGNVYNRKVRPSIPSFCIALTLPSTRHGTTVRVFYSGLPASNCANLLPSLACFYLRPCAVAVKRQGLL